MENLIFAMGIAAVTFALAYQLAILARDQKRLKKNIEKMQDFNIEFRNISGSGISKQRKNYGQLEDDFRESSDHFEPTLSELRDAQDREERHSIAGHMNDSDRATKAQYEENTGKKAKA